MGQGPLGADALLVQRWFRTPVCQKEQKKTCCLVFICRKLFLLEGSFTTPSPQALPATFLKSMEIPGHTRGQRTQVGGSFLSVWW